MTFRPTITDVVEQDRLEWLGRLVVPGHLDGRHSFDLEAVGATETRLTQAEEFSGIVVPLLGDHARAELLSIFLTAWVVAVVG